MIRQMESTKHSSRAKRSNQMPTKQTEPTSYTVALKILDYLNFDTALGCVQEDAAVIAKMIDPPTEISIAAVDVVAERIKQYADQSDGDEIAVRVIRRMILDGLGGV
jgi:hypothetical protein